MNKRKIFTLALTIAMVAILAIGGSLAYLTDTDAQANVFTTGDVYIDLVEEFDPNNAKLLPGIDVTKVINVANTGSEEAYVRIHLAIPQMLDSGSEDEPQYAAYNNTLHWNMTYASMADGLWNWNADKDGANYPGNGGTWNCYEATIDGIKYNVYVATYETKLAKGEDTAEEAIYKVFMDTKVDNQDIIDIKAALKNNIQILVCAEGGQAAGFTNAYDALNKQFGVPGTYNVNWSAVTAGPVNN